MEMMKNNTITSRTTEYENSCTSKMAWRVYYLSFPALLWLMLWFSINIGPWVFKTEPTSLLEWLHYIRAFFPFIVLFFASLLVAGRQSQGGGLSGPVRLWLVYGLTGLAACWMSPKPYSAVYWAIAYLSVFAAMNSYLKGQDVVGRAMHLNYLSWLVTTVLLAILMVVARDKLFIQGPSGLTGYGIVNRMEMVGEMAMSRSSGMARFAAVPGIVSFVFLWHGRVWKRFLWAILFFFSGVMIYIMQSRGAILGFGFAIAFIMLFLDVHTRWVGALLLVLFGALLLSDMFPEKMGGEVLNHLYRRQSIEELHTLTGRTRAWEYGWQEVMRSPVWGWGFQADRYLIKEHVHNTYLYALMTSGFVGVAAFVGGLGWAWLLFFSNLKSGVADRLGQKVLLIQVGGLLAFFTARSIPEVSGALFGVDFMVMLPILAYLSILDRQHKYWINQ